MPPFGMNHMNRKSASPSLQDYYPVLVACDIHSTWLLAVIIISYIHHPFSFVVSYGVAVALFDDILAPLPDSALSYCLCE
jgi:hypothetical protein